MSGQGVRTHHRMAVEVNDPDNTSGQDMLPSECDVHSFSQYHVLLPEGVRIGERATCPLGGIRMELIQIAWRRRYFTSGILFADIFTSGIPSADISQPDGRGGRFNFSGQTYPDPHIVLTRRVFLSVYSATVFS